MRRNVRGALVVWLHSDFVDGLCGGLGRAVVSS